MTDSGSVLVVGEGLIGTALATSFEHGGYRVLRTTRRPGPGPGGSADHIALDLAFPADWPALPEVDAAVLCAANARLADCEADPRGSYAVNVGGCVELARRLAGNGAQVVLLSTDKVFDGVTPHRLRTEAPCPKTEYGRQKAAAEEGVLEAGDRTAVLRLSKVLAPRLPLIEGWRRSLSAGETVTPFNDMFCAPVTLRLVVETIGCIVSGGRAGIFHCTGVEDQSYETLARRLAGRLGIGIDGIEPKESGLPAAHRPPHSTLDMSLERALFGIGPPCLDDVVGEIAAP